MPLTPSASFSIILRIKLDHHPGMLGEITSAIGRAGGQIGAIDIVETGSGYLVRDISVAARDQRHWGDIIEAVKSVQGAELIEQTDRTLRMHLGGKIEQRNKQNLQSRDDLSMAYTPGVARVCLEIRDDPAKAFRYTIKQNYVAVVTDGTAVLGLGDIGPEAALPVTQGKAMLFK